MPRLSNKEKKWLAVHHKQLVLIETVKGSIIEGVLHVNRTYNKQPIQDSYKIRLEIPVSNEAPLITETGGRLNKLLAERGLKKVDLHIYDSGKLCLAAPQEMKLVYMANPNIKLLFDSYIEPYLYSQSYFEQHNLWPWDHLSHNTKGILEWYDANSSLPGAVKETARQILTLARNGNHVKATNIVNRAMRRDSFNPRNTCLCSNTKRSYLKCHPHYAKLAMAIKYQ